MDTQIKKYLQIQTSEVMDMVDALRFKDADTGLIDLVERIGHLGSVSLLNFKSLSEDEIDSVLQSLKLCIEMLKEENQSMLDQNSSNLNEIAERIEELYRYKKLLLGKSTNKMVA